ncbi:hypothetical protein LZD49_13870 [Dyadobacter sp. CY261]|uniref:hypothetical protein n=1 Tax=Dyadobacter sp. CY261 TaxID=2907203 RepID=UPI001F345982|nr:hypothetical protein [Dyadobacter sp. CY261]MCF0071560.1 hypothetical protein [Dyadobacter sp. CY261]
MLLAGIFLLQFLIGFGLIDKFEVISRFPQKISLSIILGFFISTIPVFALELVHITLTVFSIYLAIAVTALAVNLNLSCLFKRLRQVFTEYHYTINVYETIFLGAICYLLFFSVWRSYAIPVTPYDSIVGIDLVAKQAIKEGHIVSSFFFRSDFRAFISTQPYYAPFTMLMQVIYRSIGLPFGQLWLGILTVSFFIFTYSKLCETISPVLAGFFVLLLVTVPELYAYTFLLQTDFSNAVFFAIAMIFTIEFLDSKKTPHLILGSMFMAAACWSRTETIVLVIPVAIVVSGLSFSGSLVQSVRYAAGYAGFCVLFTALWNLVFFKFYFPVVPDMKDQINWTGLYSIEKSTEILNGMNKYFFDTGYWGYFIYIFLGLWLVNVVFTRRKEALWPLVWLIAFYFCFFIMLHHFTLMNIEYTFRRAIMKFLLLMCLMIGRLHFLQTRKKPTAATATDKG